MHGIVVYICNLVVTLQDVAAARTYWPTWSSAPKKRKAKFCIVCRPVRKIWKFATCLLVLAIGTRSVGWKLGLVLDIPGVRLNWEYDGVGEARYPHKGKRIRVSEWTELLRLRSLSVVNMFVTMTSLSVVMFVSVTDLSVVNKFISANCYKFDLWHFCRVLFVVRDVVNNKTAGVFSVICFYFFLSLFFFFLSFFTPFYHHLLFKYISGDTGVGGKPLFV